MFQFLFLLIGGLAFAAPAAPAAAQTDPAQIGKDNIAGPYVPTPWEIVGEMLKLGDVGSTDVLYDLGSGDGRLVITAAKRHGARGVGVELQEPLVEMARESAHKDGVAERARFVAGDLFEADLSPASVVTLYLLPRFATRLVPKLRAELAPGSRIVSHDYPLSPWPPDKTLTLDVAEKEAISGSTRTTLYYYVVPARLNGTWMLAVPKALSSAPVSLRISQSPDQLQGVAEIGGDALPVRDLSVRADSIRFGLFYRGRMMQFLGRVDGREMSGEVRSQKVSERWSGRLAAAPE